MCVTSYYPIFFLSYLSSGGLQKIKNSSFHTDQRIRPPYTARCHNWHYLRKLPFIELFDTSR